MRQNEIFQESSSKFFDCFAVCYYHISTKLLEITKCYSTRKACCFQWYHSFSKILIRIDITVCEVMCVSGSQGEVWGVGGGVPFGVWVCFLVVHTALLWDSWLSAVFFLFDGFNGFMLWWCRTFCLWNCKRISRSLGHRLSVLLLYIFRVFE